MTGTVRRYFKKNQNIALCWRCACAQADSRGGAEEEERKKKQALADADLENADYERVLALSMAEAEAEELENADYERVLALSMAEAVKQEKADFRVLARPPCAALCRPAPPCAALRPPLRPPLRRWVGTRGRAAVHRRFLRPCFRVCLFKKYKSKKTKARNIALCRRCACARRPTRVAARGRRSGRRSGRTPRRRPRARARIRSQRGHVARPTPPSPCPLLMTVHHQGTAEALRPPLRRRWGGHAGPCCCAPALPPTVFSRLPS